MTDAQELELIHLRNVIGLAAFAIEARRVLQEIDSSAALLAQAGTPGPDLLALVREHNQWRECPDAAAQVLCDVYGRLDALLFQTEPTEGEKE